jgi:hypothetical protein
LELLPEEGLEPSESLRLPSAADNPAAMAPSNASSTSAAAGIRDLRGAIRCLGAYLVLPNLIFGLAGLFVFLARPSINVDYLLLGCVAPYVTRRIVRIAFALLLAIDSFVSFAPVFHFDLGVGAFSLFGGLTLRLLFSPMTLAFASGVVLVAIIGEKLSRTPGQPLEGIALLSTLALVVGLDVMAGTNSVQRTDGGLFGFNVATSTLYRTATSVYRGVSLSIRGVDQVKPAPVNSATSGLRQALTSNSQSAPGDSQDIVLVIVESLGHFRHAGVDSLVLEPLLTEAIRERYEIRGGTVPAYGATTSGEVRELCGVRGDFLVVRHIDTHDCLPAVLHREGYRTTAVHGYSRALYDRLEWYPRVGFDEMWFAEDLARIPGTELCGTTFHGVCDVDVGHLIERELLHSPRGEPRFLYWLTLDSHLPVDGTNVRDSSFACDKSVESQRFADVCNLIRLHQRVLKIVAAIAANPTLPPTRFIVVGDHAPPFFSRDKRALFAMDEVPFVELIPKTPATVRNLGPSRRSGRGAARPVPGHLAHQP